MASFVWRRDPQEAYENPYEYGAQDQYVREATAVLTWLDQRINPRVMRFKVNDTAADKALWMLRTDVLDTLNEALRLMTEKRHRPVGRLLRDAFETADLAYAIAAEGKDGAALLGKWYADKVIGHSQSRREIDRQMPGEGKRRAQTYREFSKFTHRTYRALLKSYSIGRGDFLVHDNWSESGMLVLPHTLAAYYSLHAGLVRGFVDQLRAVGFLSPEDEATLWKSTLEEHEVPRRVVRFGPATDSEATRVEDAKI